MGILMKAKGIEISDEKDNILIVRLEDILSEIKEGESFYWSILFLDGIANLGEGKSLLSFQNKVNASEKGIFIEWGGLKVLATKFQQIIETPES